MSLSFGLNNRGQTTGAYFDAGVVPGPNGLYPPGAVHGFVRDRNGRITSFAVPFPYLHGIVDINDRGQTVGFYDTPSGPGGGFLRGRTGRSGRSTSRGPARSPFRSPSTTGARCWATTPTRTRG
jgi:hypothetical protein